jgi:outer membrane protein
LSDALRLAFDRNYDYRQALAQVQASKGSYVSSWANVLPDVSASASKRQSISEANPIFLDGQLVGESGGTNTTYSAGGSISQELFVPEAYYSFRQSRASWAGARTGIGAAAQDIAIDVVTKFLDVVKNERNESLRRETLQLSDDQLRRAEALYELGAVPKADVLESKVAASRSRRDLIDAANQLVISRGRLNVALGREIDVATDVTYEPVTPPELPSAVDSAVENAMELRPDVRQAAFDLQAARLGKRATWWATLPSLRGALSWGRSTGEFDDTFDFDDVKRLSSWGFTISLDVPIFDGLITKGQKMRAAGELVRSEEALAKKELEVQLEVNEAILNLEAASASLEVSADEIASAEENLRLREAMYDHGAATVLELIQARVDLTNARFDQITAETALQLAWFNYLKATGADLRKWAP